MYFLFRETKFPAPKLRLADLPNTRAGASPGTGLELRISPLLVPATHYNPKTPAFLLLYSHKKKKISLFYTLWGKTHQHLPGLRPQSAVNYEPKLWSFTACLLLSRGGIRGRWGQGERPRRAAERRRKRSRDLACLWCSAPSPHTDVNRRVWGNKGENSIGVQTPMELKEEFCPNLFQC